MLEADRTGEDLQQRPLQPFWVSRRHKYAEKTGQLAKAADFGLRYGQYAKGLVRYAATAYGVDAW
jgi:hypothetical protein